MAGLTAPELLAKEMPLVRQVERTLEGYGYIKGTPEWDEHFVVEIKFQRQFGPAIFPMEKV